MLMASVAALADPKPGPEAVAAEDLLPGNVPERVNYSKPEIEDARKARKKLAEEYQQNSDALLGKQPVLICPMTWARIEKLGLIEPEVGVALKSVSPDGEMMEGRGYRDEAQIRVVWKFLRSLLRSGSETTIRTPSPDELNDYWAQIGWDIEDSPLFVVEHKKERFFFAFKKDEPFHVCDLNPDARPAPEKEGEREHRETPVEPVVPLPSDRAE